MHHASTSTCICERFRTRCLDNGYDMERAIELCADAGFDYQDIDFSHTEPNLPLAQDNWESWIDRLANLLQKRSVTVEQTHAHWYRHKNMRSPEEIDWNNEIIRRSVAAAERFGKDIAIVAHTNTVYDATGYNRDRSFRMNLDFFRHIGDMAAKQGNRIAIEVLFPTDNTAFGCCAEDLMELLDRLNDPLFGICWDFGHANLAKLDSVQSLKTIGTHLIATHCQDNYGVLPDIHLLPFYGHIDWQTMMTTLREIGYRGNIDLEPHLFTRTLPKDLQLECCKTAKHIADRLLSYMTP